MALQRRGCGPRLHDVQWRRSVVLFSVRLPRSGAKRPLKRCSASHTACSARCNARWLCVASGGSVEVLVDHCALRRFSLFITLSKNLQLAGTSSAITGLLALYSQAQQHSARTGSFASRIATSRPAVQTQSGMCRGLLNGRPSFVGLFQQQVALTCRGVNNMTQWNSSITCKDPGSFNKRSVAGNRCGSCGIWFCVH